MTSTSILVSTLDVICSSKLTILLELPLSLNCSLFGTDNVRGKISEHLFTPNGYYCLFIYYLITSPNMVQKRKTCSRLRRVRLAKLRRSIESKCYTIYHISLKRHLHQLS